MTMKVCKRCLELLVSSCYGSKLMTSREDSKFALLRSAIEETECELEEERRNTKVCRSKLADMKTAAVEALKNALRRNKAIYEAGIQWMTTTAPSMEAEIASERLEMLRTRDKSEKVEKTVKKVKGTLSVKFPSLLSRKKRKELLERSFG